MRALTRNVATLAIAAVLLLAGTIIATSALGSTGGDSTGPGPSGPAGHAAPAVATTNTAPVPTFQPSPAGSIFVPITPCRIADTRLGGGIVTGSSTRSFYVAGTVGFAPQGGKSGGCGVPLGATAVTDERHHHPIRSIRLPHRLRHRRRRTADEFPELQPDRKRHRQPGTPAGSRQWQAAEHQGFRDHPHRHRCHRLLQHPDPPDHPGRRHRLVRN